MSHQRYQHLWNRTQRFLENLVAKETAAAGLRPEFVRVRAVEVLACLYVNNSHALQAAAACSDQMVHPQKLACLRRLVNALAGRQVELRQQLRQLQLLEMPDTSDWFGDEQVALHDSETPVPAHYAVSRRARLQQLAEWRSDTAKGELADNADTHPDDGVDDNALLLQAIIDVQRSERARQRRGRVQQLRDILRRRRREAHGRRGSDRISEDPAVAHAAATTIQRHWRAVTARKRVQLLREQEMQLLNMQPLPVAQQQLPTAQQQVEEVKRQRRQLQLQRQQEYEEALVRIEDEIRQEKAVRMQEDMQDEIREWIVRHWKEKGDFPSLPSAEEGGSAALFDPQFVPPPAKPPKKQKGKNKKKKSKDDMKKKKGKAEPVGFVMEPSKYVPEIIQCCNEYEQLWKHKNEANNFDQRYDEEIVTREKKYEVSRDVRLTADDRMREEIEKLKEALNKDKGKKTKKKGKGKRGKKGKKGGKRGKKDLTANRSDESLIEELLEQGVIRHVPEHHLSQLTGYPTMISSEQLRLVSSMAHTGSAQQPLASPERPRPGDLRRALADWSVLTLDSGAGACRSLLLAGPHGCGKRSAVRAVCTDSGAALLDLEAGLAPDSPYQGKSGLSLLLNIVNKVARLLQPTVLLVNNAERTFAKRAPRDPGAIDTRRLKKQLPRLVRGIGAGERILLVGTSAAPWEAPARALCRTYQHVLVVPPLDHASRHQLLAGQLPATTRQLQQPFLSQLARLSAGLTAGACHQLVRAVCTEHRLFKLERRPLQLSEFLEQLATLRPVLVDEQAALDKWLAKTPLAKQLHKRQQAEGSAQQGGDKKAQKKKNK